MPSAYTIKTVVERRSKTVETLDEYMLTRLHGRQRLRECESAVPLLRSFRKQAKDEVSREVCDMHKKPFPGNIHGSLNISTGLLSLTMNF